MNPTSWSHDLGALAKSFARVSFAGLVTLLAACTSSVPAVGANVAAIPAAGTPSSDDVRAVSPALVKYASVREALWKRPGLSPRDRSFVTLAALIATGDLVELRGEVERALDNGVAPGEVSETLTHLAFYAGWGRAVAAAPTVERVFVRRGVGIDRRPLASGHLLPLDAAREADRASRVEQSFGAIAPTLVQTTTDLVFRDLWLRPALTPRDRSLVTVSALVADGRAAQLSYHLDRAMDRGVTPSEVDETLTQLAFYVGWPSVFTCLPAVKETVEKRSDAAPHPTTDQIEITRRSSNIPARGPATSFTGVATVTQLFGAIEGTRPSGGSVTFAPGARSAWHAHPRGQILIVTAGTGWVQQWGGPKLEIRAGDVVWTPPGVKHWHGATATESMTHIAIQSAVAGRVTDWMEQVSSEHYASP